MLLMLKELFINVLIIISSIFISANILRDNAINKNSNMISKIIFGITGSLISFLLMFFSIKIPGTDIIMDLRFFPLIYVFYYAGILPASIAGVFVISYRMWVFGFNSASVIASISILLYLLMYYMIEKLKINKTVKIMAYYTVSMCIILFSIKIQIGHLEIFYVLLTMYSIISLLSYIMMFYLMNYVETSNSLYQKYKEESSKDFLTGLYNTRQYDLLFNSVSKNIINHNESLGFLIIDIDFFKKINDTYGHHIGDLILIELAKVLRDTIHSTDIISRIGGEEFCILSLGSNQASAIELAERLRRTVENHDFKISLENIIQITISIGVSVYPESTNDVNNLKEIADNALYLSKQSGRNKVSIC